MCDVVDRFLCCEQTECLVEFPHGDLQVLPLHSKDRHNFPDHSDFLSFTSLVAQAYAKTVHEAGRAG